MTAQPWSRAPAINWTMLVHVVKSCPNVGSSMTSTLGAAASMDATDSLLFSPPDRVNGFALAKRERFRRSNSLSAMEYASSSVLPMDLGPMATSSRTVDAANWCSGSWNTMPIRPSKSRLFHVITLFSRWGGTRSSAMHTRPAIGLSSPARVSPSVDLPTPFLPVNAVTSPEWNSRSICSPSGKS